MGMFNFSFIIFIIMFLLSFLSFGAFFVFILIYAAKQKAKNDSAPRLTIDAKVVDKRTVAHRSHNHSGGFSHRYYSYHMTFELQDGQRTELRVEKSDFDLFCVADEGLLTIQGSRFISFERNSGEVAH